MGGDGEEVEVEGDEPTPEDRRESEELRRDGQHKAARVVAPGGAERGGREDAVDDICERAEEVSDREPKDDA